MNFHLTWQPNHHSYQNHCHCLDQLVSDIFMSMRRRRYQSLGLMKKSHNRPGDGGRLEGVGRFVSENQINDIILYNRVARARPGIRQLELADDDVDWPVEYVCNWIVKWVTRVVKWVVGIFQCFLRCVGGCERRGAEGAQSGYGGEMGDGRHNTDDSDHFGEGGRFNRRLRGPQNCPEVFWRFENCVPFFNRRILKRKWFNNPETRDWAEEKTDLFRRHVKRGFRTLCSSVGKDTKIYVISSPLERRDSQAASSSEPLSPKTYIFRADSKVLQSHSELFRQWFSCNGNSKCIETSFVTPQEMQAILVYMYTLTWPMDMMIEKVGGGGKNLDPRFLEVLAIYGIHLTLEQEKTPVYSSRSISIAEEPPEMEDQNENEIIFSEENSNFLSSNTQLTLACGGPDGHGDCSSFCQDTFQFVTEKESLTIASKKDSPPSPVSSSPTSDRFFSQFAKVKDLRLLNPSSHHRRVHPETTLSLAYQIQLKRAAATDTHQFDSMNVSYRETL